MVWKTVLISNFGPFISFKH